MGEEDRTKPVGGRVQPVKQFLFTDAPCFVSNSIERQDITCGIDADYMNSGTTGGPQRTGKHPVSGAEINKRSLPHEFTGLARSVGDQRPSTRTLTHASQPSEQLGGHRSMRIVDVEAVIKRSYLACRRCLRDLHGHALAAMDVTHPGEGRASAHNHWDAHACPTGHAIHHRTRIRILPTRNRRCAHEYSVPTATQRTGCRNQAGSRGPLK